MLHPAPDTVARPRRQNADRGGEASPAGIRSMTAPGRPVRRAAPVPGSADGPVARVFLVDDHVAMRRAVRHLLESTRRIAVIGESGSAREAVPRILVAHPDVAVVDVRLPDGSGIEVCRVVRTADPRIRVITVSTVDDPQTRREAYRAGVTTFIVKQVDGRALVDAVWEAVGGS